MNGHPIVKKKKKKQKIYFPDGHHIVSLRHNFGAPNCIIKARSGAHLVVKISKNDFFP
jgi:hypothetical protein